jgi:CheY-like chemotaxis protein
MSAAAMPRVLVADDMVVVRDLFGRFLEQAGMKPSFAVDGLEALDCARVRLPDAIVADIDMPRMDGVALCAALRADERTRDVPIVVVTGSSGDQARAALDAGCDAVLAKPCSRALLIATVRALLDRREARRAL